MLEEILNREIRSIGRITFSILMRPRVERYAQVKIRVNSDLLSNHLLEVKSEGRIPKGQLENDGWKPSALL